MKMKKVGAIDVGTTKVCTIMGDTDGESMRVLGVGIAPSHGMQKGLIVNLDEAKESIRQSVRAAEKTAGFRLESAYVGVTGSHINSTNSHGVIAISRNDQVVRPSDLKRVLDVARSVKVSGENKLLHVIPRTYIVDGQEGVKNPVGMHGFRLDVDTHIITAGMTSIQNLTQCIRSTGVEVEDLVLEPLASAEAILSPEEKQAGILMADIGGGTTDIAIFKDNSVFHTSILPVAGYQVTRDISVGLGLSFELAEEMKKKYGSVMPGEEEEPSDKTLTTDGHSISYVDLSQIIRIRVEELIRLILMELPGTDFGKLIPMGMVLTGGGANLRGIVEMSREVTRMPVRLGVPENLSGIGDVLLDPAYSTAVGLLLWKNESQGKPITTKEWKTSAAPRGFFARIARLLRR